MIRIISRAKHNKLLLDEAASSGWQKSIFPMQGLTQDFTLSYTSLMFFGDSNEQKSRFPSQGFSLLPSHFTYVTPTLTQY